MLKRQPFVKMNSDLYRIINVDQIEKVKTGNKGMHADVPVDPIVIESVKFVEKP